MSVASDVRLDSLGYLEGSFVGEGTSRAVHLISSDTGLVAGLVRRYRRDLIEPDQPWGPLAREGVVTLGASGGRRTTGSPKIERAFVGSPLGQTGVVAPGHPSARQPLWLAWHPGRDHRRPGARPPGSAAPRPGARAR